MTFDMVQALREGGGVGAIKKPVSVSARPVTQPEPIETREGVVAAAPGDWVLTDNLGNKWPVSEAHLYSHYSQLVLSPGGQETQWIGRPIEVRVVKIKEPISVSVGSFQSYVRGEPGDWLIHYGNGTFGIVAESLFDALYQIKD